MIFTNKTRQYNRASCSDNSATNQTNSLFKYINNCSPSILSGCSEQFKTSNVKNDIQNILENITGDKPTILSWEIYTSQTSATNKGVMLSDINSHLVARGVVGLHDHPGNPVTSTLFDTGYTGPNTGYADRSGNPLSTIKTGGINNPTYLAYLDEVANIISSINGPVLYRPFHEINGTWFWWNGSDRRADMILVWQQTVDYLRVTKGLHNILFVLNFDANGELGSTLYGNQALSTWWPGSSYVDVISIDYYPSGQPATLDTARFNSAYDELIVLSSAYQKPIGISEYGAQGLVAQTQDNFWSNFGELLTDKFKEIRFYCTWNGTYAPVEDGVSSTGYRDFSTSDCVVNLSEFDIERI